MRSLNPRPLKLAAVLRVPDRDKAFEIDRALKERLARFRNASDGSPPMRIGSWRNCTRRLRHADRPWCWSPLQTTRATCGGARPGAGRPKKADMPADAPPAE
jgi:hypothetical protein